MAFIEKAKLNKFLNTKDFFYNSYPDNVHNAISKIISRTNQKRLPETVVSDYLVSFSNKWHNYCVGCVDIVNSTKISATIPPHKLFAYYEIFLNSISTIIGIFGGKVIKNVGDCILYYFPECLDYSESDSIISCLNCGMAITGAHEVISQQILSNGLPSIDYRVSADYGAVLIMKTTDLPTVDLIGPPVNMCTKINHSANKNEFVIGGDFFERVKKFEWYQFQQVHSCNVGFKHAYPVYKVVQK